MSLSLHFRNGLLRPLIKPPNEAGHRAAQNVRTGSHAMLSHAHRSPHLVTAVLQPNSRFLLWRCSIRRRPAALRGRATIPTL